MKIGYARTSTIDQLAGLEAQIRDLTAAGCHKLFSEKTSSIGQRAELKSALEFIREGDTIVVTKLDRLARSVTHLGQIIEWIDKKKASLEILDLGINTGQATGKLILNVMGAISQFERETMLERQREGIAKAKADGKYRGRTPTARIKNRQVCELANSGIKPKEIAKQLSIGRSSVYRALRFNGTENNSINIKNDFDHRYT